VNSVQRLGKLFFISICLFSFFSSAIQSCNLKTSDKIESAVIEKIDYRGWKDSYRFSNGIIELIVVPRISGRVMKYGFIGKENVLWENPQLYGVPSDSQSKEWQNYGGYKLWPAPQKVWGWPPDPLLDGGSCEAEVKDGGICLTGAKSDTSGIRFIRNIKMFQGSSAVEIIQTMENTSDTDVEWGIWDVTQVRPSGRILIPSPDSGKIWGQTGALKQSQWSMKDGMMYLKHSGQTGKFFCMGDSGWMAYELAGTVYVKKFKPFPREKFPEGEANSEVYTTKDYVEMEVISPSVKLKPGEKYSFTVYWYLFESAPKLTDERLRKLVESEVKSLKAIIK
jgi:hypothetical protein